MAVKGNCDNEILGTIRIVWRMDSRSRGLPEQIRLRETGVLDAAPSPARGRQFPTVDVELWLIYAPWMALLSLHPSPRLLPTRSSMSILRLAFSFFVISALWFRWIPRSLEYFRRNYMTSGLADALLDKLEELEPVVTEFARTRSDIKSLPEDLRQRLLKLPELIRR